eukprot:1559851-Prymnesium_polylepis.1
MAGVMKRVARSRLEPQKHVERDEEGAARRAAVEWPVESELKREEEHIGGDRGDDDDAKPRERRRPKPQARRQDAAQRTRA